MKRENQVCQEGSSGSDTLGQNRQERSGTGLLAGVQQDIDGMDQTPPEDTFFTSGLMPFQIVVIEQALVDPFRGCPSFHPAFPFWGTPGDAGDKTQILVG